MQLLQEGVGKGWQGVQASMKLSVVPSKGGMPSLRVIMRLVATYALAAAASSSACSTATTHLSTW